MCLSTMTDVIFGLLEKTLPESLWRRLFPRCWSEPRVPRSAKQGTSLGKISSGALEVQLFCRGNFGFEVAWNGSRRDVGGLPGRALSAMNSKPDS